SQIIVRSVSGASEDILALPSLETKRGCCCFFQAKDGIRDDLVTGVQTCALPISSCGRATAKGRDSLQPDADVFTSAGGPCSGSESAAHLALRWENLRLVQGCEQAGLCRTRRSRSAVDRKSVV